MAVAPVIRAALLRLREEAVAEECAAGRGLDAWLGGSSGETCVRLHVLRATELGLLVQHPPSETVEQLWSPVLRFQGLGALLCRYHEGPRGEPWRHRYCTRPARTRQGYCLAHSRSGKALYELCAQGVDRVCAEAERLLRGETFTVYMLDYGGSRAKAGLTQDWRLLWRIAEQPHVSAAVVAKGLPLTEARRLEKRLGRAAAATEGAHARLEERLRSSTGLAPRLSPAERARRLASLLATNGLRGRFEAYTVEPRGGYAWPITAPRREPRLLAGRRLRLRDYWGGLLLLEDVEKGENLAVWKRSLVHRLLEDGEARPPR